MLVYLVVAFAYTRKMSSKYVTSVVSWTLGKFQPPGDLGKNNYLCFVGETMFINKIIVHIML